MGPKEAVAIAKQYVLDAYAEEAPRNLMLEEIVKEPEVNWFITIGFDLPIDREPGRNETANRVLARMEPTLSRHYKSVEISDHGKEVIGMRIRELSYA